MTQIHTDPRPAEGTAPGPGDDEPRTREEPAGREPTNFERSYAWYRRYVTTLPAS